MKPLYSGHFGTRQNCLDYSGVLISGVKDVLYHRIVNHLVPVARVHIRGMLATQGSGLEGSTVLAYTIIVAVALAYS